MSIAIQALHLRKTFNASSSNPIKALDDLSITVNEGEILGILGPNGAGKTTFLNVLSSLLLADEGVVIIAGYESNAANAKHLRRICNMSSGYPNFPFSLTVQENLEFYGRLYGLSGEALVAKVNELVDLFELHTFLHRRFDELSSGNKQRLALAKALLNDPKVLFLDEPTVGLDPDVSIKLRSIITDVLKKKGVTVLLTTHNMHEAETMCDRVAFIKNGKILRLSTPQELKRVHQTDDLEEVFVRLAKLKEAPVEAALIQTEPGAWPVQSGFPLKARGMRKWLNSSWAFAVRNYIFAVRNFFSFVELLFWPMVNVVSVGLMGNFLQIHSDSQNFILTGAIAAGVLQVAQLDVAYSLLYEIWSKSLKQTLLTPVGVTENLFGSWMIGIARGLTVFAVLAISAVTMFGYAFPSWPVTAVFLAGIFMCAFLLGLLVNILILSFGQKAEITAWMFAYLFMLLCGIYYPVEVLPVFFQSLANVIPITYFLEFLRGQEWIKAGFGFILVVIYFTAGFYGLRAAITRARRKGTIIRLSE